MLATRKIVFRALTALGALVCAAGWPALAQAVPQTSCPSIHAPRPTVAPRQTYKASAMVPAYELDEQLRWTECPAPDYPSGVSGERARNRAMLFITVDEAGAVTDIKARGGSIDPEGFFEAAVAAVRRWRTSPPRWKALPVKTSFAADIVFTPPGSTPMPGEPSQPSASAPQPTATPAPNVAQGSAPAATDTQSQERHPCPRFIVPGVTQPPLAIYGAGDFVPSNQLDERPQWVTCPYPLLRGLAQIALKIDESGRVFEVISRGAPGPDFEAARAAVLTWWMAPPPRWKGLAVKTSTALDLRDGSTHDPETDAPRQIAAVSQPVTENARPPSAAAPATSTTATAPAPASAPRAADRVTTPAPQMAAPFVVEYYYKAKWGFADEFWRLFQKNHWPMLKQQMDSGRISKVTADRPRYHATEDGRWDYRVTITFRDTAAAFEAVDTAALERRLFPDQDTFRREEQRRFEILLAHWDVPIVPQPLAP